MFERGTHRCEEMLDVLPMVAVGPREHPGFAFDERLDIVGAIDSLAPVGRNSCIQRGLFCS